MAFLSFWAWAIFATQSFACYSFTMNSSYILSWLGVAFFGSLGALLRFLANQMPGHSLIWPIGTLLVNLSGAFAAGYLHSSPFWLERPQIRLILMVGLLGGLTTFSSLILESLTLWKEKGMAPAFLYLLLSCSLGLMACFAGHSLATSA